MIVVWIFKELKNDFEEDFFDLKMFRLKEKLKKYFEDTKNSI